MVIVAVAAVTLTGCDAALDAPLPCDCPNLIQATNSVNWALEASPASDTTSRSDSGRVARMLVFSGYEDLASAQERVDIITLALEQAEFEIDVTNTGQVTARSDTLTMTVFASIDSDAGGGAEKLVVRAVYDGGDDPEIAELLAPVGEALETLDNP